MSYDVPTPYAIADQQSTVIEQQLSTDKDGNLRVIDARSERSVLGALARANAGALYANHLHLRRLADELMPDTAQDWLPRHGALWGVPRRGATGAVGSVTFTGPAGGANPNSQSAIDAATSAIRAWFLSAEFDLGAPLRLSRLSEAISAATGETYHRISAPAADVLAAQNEMLVLGALTVTGIP